MSLGVRGYCDCGDDLAWKRLPCGPGTWSSPGQDQPVPWSRGRWRPKGQRVLLVDKSAFPREKVCGSCLNGAALAALGVAGLADLPQRLGALALRNMRLRAGRHEANLALPGGASLSRRALDAALVRAAIESGAAFLPSTDATLEPTAGEFREVRLRSAGQEVKVKTRIAVAADGLSGGFLKETPGMEPIVARRRRWARARWLRGASDVLRAGHDLYGVYPRRIRRRGAVGRRPARRGLGDGPRPDAEPGRGRRGGRRDPARSRLPGTAGRGAFRGTLPLSRRRPLRGGPRAFRPGRRCRLPRTVYGRRNGLGHAAGLAPRADRRGSDSRTYTSTCRAMATSDASGSFGSGGGIVGRRSGCVATSV